MVKELICISCPMGCHLKVDVDNKTVTGMKVINETTVNAPIKMGDILIKDVLGTGIDVVASRDIECN